MNEKILIVEDDNDINRLLSDILSESGYDVTSAYSGTEALLHINNSKWDIVLLDLMLPGKSGEEVLTEIRKESEVPIIVISAKGTKEAKIEALQTGADDFIVKPFDIDEVQARVVAQVRRYKKFSSNESLDSNIIVYKEISLNKDTMEVMVNSNKLNLTTREYEILKLLMEFPKKVYSKSNIFESVWNEEFLGDDSTILVHISNIRNKIKKANAEEDYIKTVWGIGYKLEV